MCKLSVFTNEGEFLPDTIRPVASIIKVLTTTGILKLMERGKLFLIQPVSSIIKEFDTEMHRYINIFQLLIHTSGLSADPGAFLEPYVREWYGENCNKEDWLKKVIAGPLQFKPLGMDDSFFFVPDAKKSRVCTISEWNRIRLNGKRTELPTSSLLGRGGIFSNLNDLWKFGQMMLNGGTFNGNRILSRKTVEAVVKPQKKGIIAYNWQPHIYDYSFKWTYGLGDK